MENILMNLWGEAYTPEIYSFFMTVAILLILISFLKVLIIVALNIK